MKNRIAPYGIPFLLGSMCFLISQVLLRIPLLNWTQSRADFMVLYLTRPLFMLFVIALSAGVFEEGFRHLFRRHLLRTSHPHWSEPVLFGLGHGITEAFYLLIPAIQYSSPLLGVAAVERVFAIGMHIGLTVLVWNGFQKGQSVRYLLLAIVIHGLINFTGAYLQTAGYSLWTVEGVLGVISVLFLFYAVRSKKYYVQGGPL